jgi:carboxypeptidase C (cathepsin A)
MTRFIHYWFVESQANPSKDPVVMWMNGGPGCSSLYGYFYEMGPLHFMSDASNQTDPQLVENPNTWSKIANMLYIESPVGVGFSYSTRGRDDYVTNDTQTAEDNLRFIINFFSAYSEYKEHDFYISGESYAGVYIPTLVDRIRQHNMANNSLDHINLKGFMVGNGCVGTTVGACSDAGKPTRMKFLHGHDLISEAEYSKLIEKCGPNLTNQSHICQTAIDKAFSNLGTLNVYDIYAPCIITGDDPEMKVWQIPVSQYGNLKECNDVGVGTVYLNTPAVREAIHVKPVSSIGLWTMCTTNISYHFDINSVLDVYPSIIKQYRTLIFNGDVDAAVTYLDNEEWISKLGFPIKEAWRPWMVNDQVAGYVTSYDINNFKFVTVKGAGHMVPQFQPVTAYAMFERFLKKLEF